MKLCKSDVQNERKTQANYPAETFAGQNQFNYLIKEKTIMKMDIFDTLCHKKQTKIWALLTFLGLFLALSVSLEARGSSNSDGTKTIRYGIWDDSFQPGYLKEIITAFEQENPGVQVDLQVVPYADYWPKLRTSLSAGTAWDVFWINAPYFPVYESYGVISDLSDEYRKAGVDFDKFPKALVEMYQVDGRPYTLPWFFDIPWCFTTTRRALTRRASNIRMRTGRLTMCRPQQSSFAIRKPSNGASI